jgi:hypothetical protein
MRYGDSVSPTRGFTVQKDADFQTAEIYVQRLNAQLYDVLSASTTHTDRVYRSLDKQDQPLNISIGDYVVVSYPEGPPTKLSPMYRGPMIVLETIRNDGYLCQDIITQTQLQISKDRVRLFKLPPRFNVDSMQTLAAADHGEFAVERILDMRGDPKKKKSLEFLVKWKGYDVDENSWEPWSHVRNLQALDDFFQSRPGTYVK